MILERTVTAPIFMIMKIQDATIAVIDFEGTGVVDDCPNVPWQIGMVFFQDGKPDLKYCFSSLLQVDAQRPFNIYAPGRYAKIRKEIAVAPTIHDLWPTLSPWIQGRILAAHNVSTEKGFLGRAFPLHPLGPWIDTLTLARIAYPDAASHKLEDLLDSLELKEKTDAACPGLEAHDAFYDAVGCAFLLEHLLALPGWEGLDTDDLVNARPDDYFRIKNRKQKLL